jgi:ubiquinol-cytochrome c reductase cytochrome b subunit
LILMMAIAFLGYVLPYGQMSLWGFPQIALNAIAIFYNFIFSIEECLGNQHPIFFYLNLAIIFFFMVNFFKNFLTNSKLESESKVNIPKLKLRAEQRIGPHNLDILSIIFGSLLGDAHAEYRSKGKGTRITFYQEYKHSGYLIWLHNLISELGYCNSITPIIQTRLGKKGVIRKIIRFKTWTYSNFNWIHELWYKNNVKVVPLNIDEYLTPLALAIWIMDDGTKSGSSLKFATNSFTYSECLLLVKVLYDNFNIKASVQSAGVENQYVIYILSESMSQLREIVLPYIHPSMKYKLNIS